MLETKIKEVIIQRLNLPVNVEEISNEAPIFNNPNQEQSQDDDKKGLQLDSIDALEVVVALNKEFNVKITDKDMNIFESVNTIAEYIRKNSDVASQYEKEQSRV
jgi:acyl carrier protein